MSVEEEIQAIDMDDLIDRMTAYAISHLKSIGVKDLEGKEPVDFVSNVILKTLEGTRDWEKAKCPFNEFLFGCLKSDIDSFFKSKKTYTNEFPDISSIEEDPNIDKEKEQISELLRNEGADDDELIIFECWMDGMLKPSEIAEYLGVDVRNVYNITKRLERRLWHPKIQIKLKKII